VKGQGKTERAVIRSERLPAPSRERLEACRPKEALFEERPGGKYYERSAQTILESALAMAKIRKPGVVRALLHSFAARLLKNGTVI